WCRQSGFALNDETRAHLLGYAAGSPIFLAAKYNTPGGRVPAASCRATVLITLPSKHLWVPLEMLADDNPHVQADLYLLIDQPVNTSDVGARVGQTPLGSQVPGAPGCTVAFQEPMTEALHRDLSRDRNMGWVPRNAWQTYLALDTPGR